GCEGPSRAVHQLRARPGAAQHPGQAGRPGAAAGRPAGLPVQRHRRADRAGLRFTVPAELTALGAAALLSAVGAIGLNLVTGYAGQISLGQAFFIGLGAYTAAVLSGDPDGRSLGYGLDMAIWLPAAGLVPALVGLLVAPVAIRLKGLYLAIVTLGLVFIGEHLFRELTAVTGGPGVGRPAAQLRLLGVDLGRRSEILGGAPITRATQLS